MDALKMLGTKLGAAVLALVRRLHQHCPAPRFTPTRLKCTETHQGTALMTVEGERDDICSVGQTVAAQDLCSAVRPYWRQHHVQTGVGHYGVFSGRRWQRELYPRVRDLIHQTSV